MHLHLAEENIVRGRNEHGADDKTAYLDHERHPVRRLRIISH